MHLDYESVSRQHAQNNQPAEADEAKRHFAANFNTIINATGIGMWDWDLDSGKIVHSGQLERIAGYEDGEMPAADKSARDLLIHPADRKRADDIIAACVEGKIESYETEFRIICKSGGVKWVQDRGAAAERDENGRARRIVGMFYDVNRFKQTEESLTEKVRLLDFAAGISGLGSLDWNVASGALQFDEDFLRMFGYTEDEVAKDFSGLRHFLHPDDFPVLAQGLAEYIQDGGREDIYSQQVRALHKDGRLLWVMATARIVEWDSAGGASRVFAGVLNVDKLVRAELEAQKALKENQEHRERLQKQVRSATRDLEETRRTSEAMYDANPYMNIIFDDKFEPVDCNPALIDYFGFPDKETALQNIISVLKDAIPEHQPNGKVSFTFAQRMIDTMKAGFNEFETVFVFDGREVPMSIIMKRIAYRDSFALAAYQVDLTSIKKAENELLRQDRLLKSANAVASMLMESEQDSFADALQEALRILCKSLGVDRAYVWQNAIRGGALWASQLSEWVEEQGAGYLEYGEREFCYDEILPGWQEIAREMTVINAPVGELAGELGGFPGLSDVKSALLIPIVLQGNFWGFLGFDDCRNERHFNESDENIMRSAGILMALAVQRNVITENLIAAKEAALEGSRAKSDFLSRMSHEIRTPMNAIIGMTTIARKSDDMAKMRYCLDKIDSASRQLLDLINDVLDMSKIEANKLELTPNEFDFEKMVQNVFNVVNMKMEEKHLDLSIDIRDLFPRKMICDELRLSQVLINLLNNAAKFTPEHGKIRVKVRHATHEDEAVLHVEVQDSGIGVTDEQKQRLFNAFEQADGSTTRKYGGTGLGLAICKSIVRLMGGDIWVDSAPGGGACFQFDVNFKWGEALGASLPLPAARGDLRILVVDDSEDVRDYFQNILSSFSLLCDAASCGEDAVEMAAVAQREGRPYDVAFIDWIMPGMGGGDTAVQLRQAAGGGTEIVMISVADRVEVEAAVADIGVAHFLAKPVLPSTLYNTVVSLTERTLVRERPEEQPDAYNWNGKQLLLVEDIEINREIIINVLEETGIGIECACDGLEAVEVFRDHGDRYDLILMDVQMPRLDGLGATRQIRSCGLHGCADTPIIAMTANAFKEDVDRCLAAGMNGHVAKPIDMSALFDTLTAYLEC